MVKNVHIIGNIITKLRKEKGWTQNELAEKLHVSNKAISKWESNKGDPSIEFFPKLAELFNVTIDYLMTGKEQKEKIVAMSKLEVCAQNDDVQLFQELEKNIDELSCYRDESGVGLLDYIFKYNSINLFKTIIESSNYLNYISNYQNNFGSSFENLYYMRLLCDDISVIRDLIRLEYKNSTLKTFIQNDKGIWYNGNSNILIPRKIIGDKIIDFIVNGNIHKSIYNAIISNHAENGFSSPALIFPYIIEFILKQKDWKKGKALLNKAITINKENLEKQVSENCYKGFVQIPNSTFDFLFKLEKYDFIELASQINKIANDYYNRKTNIGNAINYVATNDDIKKNKINKNNKLTEVEKQKFLCVHDGIVNLDELIAINDFKFYETMIKKYPICEYEILFNQLYNKEYDKVESFVKTLPDFSIILGNNPKLMFLRSLSYKKYDNLENYLEECIGRTFRNTCNSRYIERYISKKNPDTYYNKKANDVTYDKLMLAKHHLFLNEVLNKDLKFIERACKTATKTELDKALTQISPDNFKGINILLNHGAMLKKSWLEEDGDGDKRTITEDDKIGTEILKKKIKDILK